ncbi:MAG: hypothetical protein KGH75_00640 [Rhodospirillales bacterium]|nr:hypothetical protein [Rhodospirillales bacterium]
MQSFNTNITRTTNPVLATEKQIAFISDLLSQIKPIAATFDAGRARGSAILVRDFYTALEIPSDLKMDEASALITELTFIRRWAERMPNELKTPIESIVRELRSRGRWEHQGKSRNYGAAHWFAFDAACRIIATAMDAEVAE